MLSKKNIVKIQLQLIHRDGKEETYSNQINDYSAYLYSHKGSDSQLFILEEEGKGHLGKVSTTSKVGGIPYF